MPNFITVFGYHIYFWSNEGYPLEPIHVHVSKNVSQNSTKFWINSDGSIELENNNSRIPNNELKKIEKTILLYIDDIIEKWKSYFNQEPTFHDRVSYEEKYDRD